MSTVNPWRQFKGLLPGGSRSVVTVTAVNADGTSAVRFRNNDTALVRGVGVPVGGKALVVDGELKGVVPSLPQFTGEFI